MNDYILKHTNRVLDTIEMMIEENAVVLDDETSVSLEIAKRWCNEQEVKRRLERE